MNKRIQRIAIYAAAASCWLCWPNTTSAQQTRPPGDFSPEKMRQRMLDRLRQQFEVKDDAEWSIISARISKVMEAARVAGERGGFGGPGGPPPFGDNRSPGQRSANSQNNAGPPAPPGSAGPGGAGGPVGGPAGSGGPGAPPNVGVGPDTVGRPGGPPGMGGDSNPELEALRKAIESKAPTAELKTRLARLRDARAKKEADLDSAREELRKILSTRQEAIAVTMGLLK